MIIINSLSKCFNLLFCHWFLTPQNYYNMILHFRILQNCYYNIIITYWYYHSLLVIIPPESSIWNILNQTEIKISCARIVSSVSDTITSVFVYRNRFTSLQSRNDFAAVLKNKIKLGIFPLINNICIPSSGWECGPVSDGESK